MRISRSPTVPRCGTKSPARGGRSAASGVTPRFFCYPAGRYDAETIAAVEAAGYEGATTTRFGLASPTVGRFTLARVRIDRGDGAYGLMRKLAALGLPTSPVPMKALSRGTAPARRA